jgi:hypothetical protein
MKKYSSIFLISIFFLLSISFITQANQKKGCTYTCTHEVSGNVLTLKTQVTYGPDCDWTTVVTTVEFGDSATGSWESSSTHTHYYCCDGAYHVTVKAPDINITQTFLIYIGDSTGDAGDSVSALGCVPDYGWQKTYDELNKKFMICCVRTDTCLIPNLFWYATGQPQFWGDSVVFLYPDVDSGEVKTICLERNTTQYGNPVCKEVLLSIVDEPIDSIASVHTFPNPVHNSLQVEVVNLKEGAEIEVYSPDGRRIFDYKLQPSTVKSEFFINMKNFSSGIYFMKVISGNNYSLMQKIVKE